MLQWRLISGACLLLGGASVAVPASDWTERHRSRIAASLLLPGGMSTSTADSEVRAAFRAMLSAERAGYKLAVALVSTLVSYLVGTAELSDVSELDMSTLLTTAADAWAATHEGEDLPSVHRSRLERWIANVPATITVEGDASVAVSPSTGSLDEDLMLMIITYHHHLPYHDT